MVQVVIIEYTTIKWLIIASQMHHLSRVCLIDFFVTACVSVNSSICYIIVNCIRECDGGTSENEDPMVIDKKILDELTEQAKRNPRLRQSMDLRNSPEDMSQRMLNALEPGTVMPKHRHKGSSETCICIRGHLRI